MRAKMVAALFFVLVLSGSLLFSVATGAQPAAGHLWSADALLIPHESWTCGMPEGIPRPEKGKLVFEANLQLDAAYHIGKTPYGQREVFVIKSGTITGEKIKGSVMPGGIDFQLDIANGVREVEQIFIFKTDDGKYIYFRNTGTGFNQNDLPTEPVSEVPRDRAYNLRFGPEDGKYIYARNTGTGWGKADLRMVSDIEAPKDSAYSWLNTGKYVGRRVVDTAAKTMKISVYDVSSVKHDPKDSVTIIKPAHGQNQPRDYRQAPGETNGEKFITELVLLGESQSVGATKNGNRNIIPITGGNVTGDITAKILPAGADYQQLAMPMTIGARYLWQTDDGEIIIVRNGGQFSALVPSFEVREDSKYSYLNTRLYLSSNPAMGQGGVTITFYESKKQ